MLQSIFALFLASSFFKPSALALLASALAVGYAGKFTRLTSYTFSIFVIVRVFVCSFINFPLFYVFFTAAWIVHYHQAGL